MKGLKRNFSTILLVLILIVGLSLLLYPSFSDYWNSFHQSKAIASYADDVASLDKDKYKEMWQQAVDYNRKLKEKPQHWILTDEERKEYESILDITGTGIMGYIDIPSINVSLPIYHGVDEGILQVAIGHLEGSSLPVGGEGTHCVVSGHRGLPSARLFTDLDKLREGDIFVMRVLDETLTYEVDQIRIVLPDEVSDLEIQKGKDLCTLVTCTPYGINTHRLLVRGHRIPNLKDSSDIRVVADAQQIDTNIVAIIVSIPVLILLFIWLMTYYRRRR